jgi:ligand-binding SRPBCC domain-containing protein
MPHFYSTFTVPAPLTAVVAFHHDAHALPRLSPPLLFTQMHRVDPMQEGAIAEFTLWFGPLPIRWTALHTDVHPGQGFTDTQTAGPLRYWRHTHRFDALAPSLTQVTDHVEYEHHPGLRGLFTRVLFNPLALRVLFLYRAWATRRFTAPPLVTASHRG